MFYVGQGNGGPIFLPKESHLLVVGPPRSGKTRSVVIPNILAAPGPVVATSTKTDLVDVSSGERRKNGSVFLFDPSGAMPCPPGVERIYWSPVDPRGSYSDALSVTRSMVDGSLLLSANAGYSHWIERASSLVAPLVHAAQVAGYEMDTVMKWIQHRDCKDPAGILRSSSEDLALDALTGVLLTEDRERSGIFSTAVGLLASYTYPELSCQSQLPRFDSGDFLASRDTLFVVSPSHIQKLVAPVIVGLIDEIKNKSFALSSRADQDRSRLPLALILDEMANVAPLGSISSILSEGASQKVMLLGALQDLSQARVRWGEASKGFLTLFGSTLVLPGVSDMASIQQFSEIADRVGFESISRTSRSSFITQILGNASVTRSGSFRPVLEPWQVARSVDGQGFLFRRSRDVRKVKVEPLIGFEPIGLGDVVVRG